MVSSGETVPNMHDCSDYIYKNPFHKHFQQELEDWLADTESENSLSDTRENTHLATTSQLVRILAEKQLMQKRRANIEISFREIKEKAPASQTRLIFQNLTTLQNSIQTGSVSQANANSQYDILQNINTHKSDRPRPTLCAGGYRAPLANIDMNVEEMAANQTRLQKRPRNEHSYNNTSKVAQERTRRAKEKKKQKKAESVS